MTPTLTVTAPDGPSAYDARSPVQVAMSWRFTARLGWVAPRITMAAMLQQFAEARQFRVAELKGPGRTRDLARARQELMWLLRQQDRWSLPQIGRLLGRDHTTILHGVRAYQARLDAKAAAE